MSMSNLQVIAVDEILVLTCSWDSCRDCSALRPVGAITSELCTAQRVPDLAR